MRFLSRLMALGFAAVSGWCLYAAFSAYGVPMHGSSDAVVLIMAVLGLVFAGLSVVAWRLWHDASQPGPPS